MVNNRLLEEFEAFEKEAGPPGFVARLWYNPDGDCLVYKSQNVAVVAARVDDILTIYESAVDDKAIGFKIKGVKHLLQEMGCGAMAVGTATDQAGEIVTVAMVFLQAFSSDRPTIARREGYARAWETLTAPIPVFPCARVATEPA
jgi:hypothetical protein